MGDIGFALEIEIGGVDGRRRGGDAGVTFGDEQTDDVADTVRGG